MCNYPAGDWISSNLFAPQHEQEWVIMMTFFCKLLVIFEQSSLTCEAIQRGRKTAPEHVLGKELHGKYEGFFLLSNYITREKLVG